VGNFSDNREAVDGCNGEDLPMLISSFDGYKVSQICSMLRGGANEARFKIPEKFLPVPGTEYSRNQNFDRNFDFVPVISGVF
jgi:hypothetical protein